MFGIGPIEIVVLVAIVAAIVAFVRHASWKTLIAVPLGLLLLVSVASILYALLARSHVRVDSYSLQTQPITWSPSQEHFWDQSTKSQFANAVEGLPHQAKLFFMMLAFFSVSILTALLYRSRKWIARNAGVLIPIAGLGAVGLLCVLGVGTYSWQIRDAEVSLRAQEQRRLVEMAEAMQRATPPQIPVMEAAPREPMTLTVIDESPKQETVAAAVDATTAAVAEVPAGATQGPAELPEWVRTAAERPDDLMSGSTVIVSERWATEEDSERQLMKHAKVLIASRFERDHPELSGWRPETSLIHESGAVAQRFVEKSTLEVGSFAPPMYRTYWELQYTPALADRAYALAKEATVHQRLTWLGIGTAAVSMLFAMIAAGLRIDSATQGRRRGRLAIASAASVAAIVAGAAALVLE